MLRIQQPVIHDLFWMHVQDDPVRESLRMVGALQYSNLAARLLCSARGQPSPSSSRASDVPCNGGAEPPPPFPQSFIVATYFCVPTSAKNACLFTEG